MRVVFSTFTWQKILFRDEVNLSIYMELVTIIAAGSHLVELCMKLVQLLLSKVSLDIIMDAYLVDMSSIVSPSCIKYSWFTLFVFSSHSVLYGDL